MNQDGEFLLKSRSQLHIHLASAAETCRFALATDSHFSEKEALGEKHYADALLKTEEFIKTVNTLQCDFAIHLGDFKDEDLHPDPKTTQEYLRLMELEYAKFNGRRFHCIGNHDLDSITKAQFLNRVENSGIESDKGYYSFEINAIKFIVLDANFDSNGRDHFFLEGGDWQSPVIPEAQLDWLERELSASAHPCVIFCHHPLYAYVKNGHSYHVTNYLEVREALEGSGKILAVFNGHMHEEMFHEINRIHYLSMNSMLEGTFIQRNCFYVIEMRSGQLIIDRYDRINNYL